MYRFILQFCKVLVTGKPKAGPLLFRRKNESHNSPFLFFGRDVHINFQCICQLAAQIKPHTGGASPQTAVASGKSSVEYTGQFMSRNSDSVIRDGQLNLSAKGMGA